MVESNNNNNWYLKPSLRRGKKWTVVSPDSKIIHFG